MKTIKSRFYVHNLSNTNITFLILSEPVNEFIIILEKRFDGIADGFILSNKQRLFYDEHLSWCLYYRIEKYFSMNKLLAQFASF